MINNDEIISSKLVRDQFISKVDVLEKVGDLLMLPNTEYATKHQVSQYYETNHKTIDTIYRQNKDELISDGVRVFSKGDVIDLLMLGEQDITNYEGKAVAKSGNEEIVLPNRGMVLFSKRAILRIGMLLKKSDVAKEVRSRLLDIVHDTSQEQPAIIEAVVEEVNEEKNLMFERIEAEINGDYDKVCEINAKLFSLKNKRIEELEKTNNTITTNALTITESRIAINKIVRAVAVNQFGGAFGLAWSNFYSWINYKLGINIRGRDKSKCGSYIKTLTDEETFEVELIARSWATVNGLDVDGLLKIA